MAKINIEETKKLAKLSRLEFTDEELADFVNEFDKTLEYVEKISKVNTDDVKLFEKTISAKNELREDAVRESLTQDKVVLNAPESEDGALSVPTTVEEGGQ